MEFSIFEETISYSKIPSSGLFFLLKKTLKAQQLISLKRSTKIYWENINFQGEEAHRGVLLLLDRQWLRQQPFLLPSAGQEVEDPERVQRVSPKRERKNKTSCQWRRKERTLKRQEFPFLI